MLSTCVLIPVYNANEVELQRALSSIARQTSPVSKVIVVDDGSTVPVSSLNIDAPDCMEIVRLETNSGIAKALSFGIEHSSEDVILRLDADDYWAIEHVKTAIETLSLEDCCLSSSGCISIDETGTPLRTNTGDSKKLTASDFILDNPIIHSGAAFKRKTYLKTIGYDNNFMWEDYRLWIDFLKYGKIIATGRPTTYYQVSTHSLSRVNKKIALRERLNIASICYNENYLKLRLARRIYFLLFRLITIIRIKQC